MGAELLFSQTSQGHSSSLRTGAYCCSPRDSCSMRILKQWSSPSHPPSDAPTLLLAVLAEPRHLRINVKGGPILKDFIAVSKKPFVFIIRSEILPLVVYRAVLRTRDP